MIRYKFLTLIFLLPFFSLSAQDISGLWQGVLSLTGATRYYVCTMTLEQSGSNVTGTSYTKEVARGFYGIHSLSGTVSNNVFNFSDQVLIAHADTIGFTWCLKSGNLNYDPSVEKLSGIVQTSNCFGETITMELYRLKITADTNICNAKNVPIQATGQNLRWYKDSTKQTLLYSGNAINPFVTKDTTFYVTQTLYNTESPVVPVTIHVRSYNIVKNINICEGKSIVVGDTVYRTTGTYTKKLLSMSGCDSIITTNLAVTPALRIQRILNICSGETVTVGDTVYRTSGVYTKKLKNTEGCDSIITTNLTVVSSKTTNQNFRLCEGETITVGDTIYKTTGQYRKLLRSVQGCDSLVSTNLVINPVFKKTQSLNLCEGQSIIVGDTTYKTTGIYTKKYTSINGCDSTIITNLTVNPIKKTSQTLRICSNQSVIVGDTVYRTTGDYTRILRSFAGCDSLVTTKLTVQNEVSFNQKLKICEGASVSVGDTTYRTNGIFIKRLRSTSGCDSIVTTELSVTKLDLITSHDTLINLGDSAQLSAFINPPLSGSWKWTPSNTVKCDTCPTTWAKPKTTTVYQIEVLEKENKCRKTATVSVRTKNGCDLFVPTAFSPNGDNMNDKLMIYPSACVKRIKRFAVFNRWGGLIISKNDILTNQNQEIEMWDGTINGRLVENDTFVYFVEAEYVNGESEIIGGDFTILK